MSDPRALLNLPASVEYSQSDLGAKIAVVDACGKVIVKTPSNRVSDLSVANMIAALLNDKAREMSAVMSEARL